MCSTAARDSREPDPWTAQWTASLELPAEPWAVPAARAFVASRTDALDEQTRYIAVLLTSEVVTNGVIHAGTPLVLRVQLEGQRLYVGVSDGAPVDVDLEPLPPSTTRTAGRGLALVRLLADACGSVSRADGKTVWFRLAARAVGQASLA